jgi:hypothetical protein
VFGYGGDPVVDGLVASLNRPAGNVTGTTFIGTTLTGKRLELLRELVPQMTDVALLVNRKSTLAENQIKDAEAATQALGQRLHVVNASSEAEIDAGFETISQSKANALMISTDPTLGLLFLRRIVALAERASPLETQGGSRMPELGPYGSVRGARGNSRPYRESDRRISSIWTECKNYFEALVERRHLLQEARLELHSFRTAHAKFGVPARHERRRSFSDKCPLSV